MGSGAAPAERHPGSAGVGGPARPQRPSFEAVWSQAHNNVRAYCRSKVGNDSDADDLFQIVALRAWRGYPSFRGDAPFLSWVMGIARNEAARMWSIQAERQLREVPLRSDSDVESPPGRGGGGVALGWLSAAVALAGECGVLTETESRVVRQRLAYPDAPWEQIGNELSLTAPACALAHCRAIPKLRVLLFQRFQAELGGRDAIVAAYQRACAAADQPLTASERQVFELVVLAGRADYRGRGWLANLRRACGLVVRHLDMGDVAGIP